MGKFLPERPGLGNFLQVLAVYGYQHLSSPKPIVITTTHHHRNPSSLHRSWQDWEKFYKSWPLFTDITTNHHQNPFSSSPKPILVITTTHHHHHHPSSSPPIINTSHHYLQNSSLSLKPIIINIFWHKAIYYCTLPE